MQPDQTGRSNGGPRPPADSVNVTTELEAVRAAGERQAQVVRALTVAVSTLRAGAMALRAENAELRADNERVRRQRVGNAGSGEAGEALEVRLPLDARAPAAARMVLEAMVGRVPLAAREDAMLVVSELVANSVRHSDAVAGAVVIVRIALTETTVRLEVIDPGRGGAIAPQAPDPDRHGGFGLHIVQAVSERWGLERAGAGGTRVWALLPHAPQRGEGAG